jgi:hypothetical protein
MFRVQDQISAIATENVEIRKKRRKFTKDYVLIEIRFDLGTKVLNAITCEHCQSSFGLPSKSARCRCTSCREPEKRCIHLSSGFRFRTRQRERFCFALFSYFIYRPLAADSLEVFDDYFQEKIASMASAVRSSATRAKR